MNVGVNNEESKSRGRLTILIRKNVVKNEIQYHIM